MGEGFASTPAFGGWIRAGRFLGDGCAQMAERELRLRNRGGAGPDAAAGCVVHPCRISSSRRRKRADQPNTRRITTCARSRVVGGAEIPRAAGTGGVD